jgi:hypothetical protein
MSSAIGIIPVFVGPTRVCFEFMLSIFVYPIRQYVMH